MYFKIQIASGKDFQAVFNVGVKYLGKRRWGLSSQVIFSVLMISCQYNIKY